jgi:uncharacterized protein YbjT (DUF2867 family)
MGGKEKEKKTMKTLIIGCTGTVGNTVMKKLARQGVGVRCMSRSADKLRGLPSGVEGCVADLDNPNTLAAAFSGMDSAFLLNVVSRNETRQGLAAVEAAKAARVKKIVYLSVYMPEGSTHIPHFSSKIPIENAIKASGITYTILRPNNFFQNDLALKDTIMRYGVYPQPIGPIGVNRVDVRDIADCAVNALTKPGFEGQTYAIHGPDSLTGNDIARTYSRYIGRDVRYGGNDLDAWVQQVKNIMPDWFVRDLRVMYKFFQDHGMIADKADLEKQQKLLDHTPRSFDDFAKEVAGEWKVAPARAA